MHCLEHTFDSLKKFLASGTPVDYIGTRLHGGVFCLLRGKRSLIVEVDNRATEIARDTGLPTVKRVDLETLRRWIAGSDVSRHPPQPRRDRKVAQPVPRPPRRERAAMPPAAAA